MIAPKLPADEPERQASLERMQLVSTPREPDLDRIVRFAQQAFQSEIATISLIDHDRQWFKARCGIDALETPRAMSFCGHAIERDGPLVVPNALEDLRFHDNPLVVGEPGIRFYAGQPLTNGDGFRVGTLCVISNAPRVFTEDDDATLRDLARMVEIIFEHRKLNEAQRTLVNDLAAAERDRLIDPLTGLWNRRGLDQLFQRELDRSRRLGQALTVAMADIDHFKRINDGFGHLIGDQAIKQIAGILVDAVRDSDVVGRFGGEEFAIILPGLDAASLPLVGDKLLRAVRAGARVRAANVVYPYTLSFGFATVPTGRLDDTTPELLLEAADQALYAAKRQGRDRYNLVTV